MNTKSQSAPLFAVLLPDKLYDFMFIASLLWFVLIFSCLSPVTLVSLHFFLSFFVVVAVSCFGFSSFLCPNALNTYCCTMHNKEKRSKISLLLVAYASIVYAIERGPVTRYHIRIEIIPSKYMWAREYHSDTPLLLSSIIFLIVVRFVYSIFFFDVFFCSAIVNETMAKCEKHKLTKVLIFGSFSFIEQSEQDKIHRREQDKKMHDKIGNIL